MHCETVLIWSTRKWQYATHNGPSSGSSIGDYILPWRDRRIGCDCNFEWWQFRMSAKCAPSTLSAPKLGPIHQFGRFVGYLRAPRSIAYKIIYKILHRDLVRYYWMRSACRMIESIHARVALNKVDSLTSRKYQWTLIPITCRTHHSFSLIPIVVSSCIFH